MPRAPKLSKGAKCRARKRAMPRIIERLDAISKDFFEPRYPGMEKDERIARLRAIRQELRKARAKTANKK